MKRLALSVLVGTALFLSAAAVADPSGMPGMPPNIQKIMQKLQNGQQPTPAEQKALTQWSEGAAGIQQGSPEANAINQAQQNAPKGNTFEVGTGEDRNPCRKAGKAAGFGAAPSRDAYVAMAKDAMRIWREKMPDGADELDALLKRATNPDWGGSFSLMLIARGSGSAAIVSAAYAAEKNPSNPITANNLGVALRGMKEYARAAVALQYAKSLAPASDVVATNLGWLAMSQGDSGTAGKFFSAALSKNRQMSSALAGQGLIAQCGGHPAQALPLFRASMAAGYSDLAAAGIDSAADDLAKGKNGGSSPGNPGVYGPKGSPTGLPDLPDPPFSHDAAQIDAMMIAGCPNGPMCKYGYYLVQVHAAQKPGSIKRAETFESGGTLTFKRGYNKEDFVLSDIRRMMNQIMLEHSKPWEDAVSHAVQAAGCGSCAGGDQATSDRVIHCQLKPLAIAQHGKIFPIEPAQWTLLKKDYADLAAFSQPWLARIHDQSTLDSETRDIVGTMTASAGAYNAVSQHWGGEVQADFFTPTCSAPAPAKPFPVKPIKPYKIDPLACKSGEAHMNFGVANFNADCSQMVLTFGEGAVFSGTYKFGNDWSDDQITIFGGAGVGGGLGPLAVNANTGAFVTLQGGHIVDYGNQTNAGVTIGYGPMSASAGVTAQIAGVSGVDVSTSAGTRVGGECTNSC